MINARWISTKDSLRLFVRESEEGVTPGRFYQVSARYNPFGSNERAAVAPRSMRAIKNDCHGSAFGKAVSHHLAYGWRESGMKRVLIPGAGGGIGRSLRETLRGVYPVLRVSDRMPIAPAGPEDQGREEVDQTDIADMAAVERMVAGVDGIIHLGGISGENTWEKVLESNIVGLYNVFEAARRAGVKRVVMATSKPAGVFYPRAQTIEP